jgi:hypothetical protein
MAAEMVGAHGEVPGRSVGRAVGEQGAGARGGACGSTAGKRVAIAHAHGPLDPGLLAPAVVLHRRLDAVAIA